MHTVLLNHARAIRDCAQRLELIARLELATFRLKLSGRNRAFELFPRFIAFEDGVPEYSSDPEHGSRGLVGWLPYADRSSPLATDKLVFKRLCLEQGLLTPPHWEKPDPSVRDFMVKPRSPCSGHRIRGPFRAFDPRVPEQTPREDEYCEQFRTDGIAKAWYWNDKLVCLDVRKMPSVEGDGAHALPELIAPAMRGSTRVLPEHTVAALAAYQGVGLNEALPPGKSTIADFRYMSALTRKGAPDVLAHYAERPAGRQLSAAGRVLWRALSRETPENTLWTVDSIIDGETGEAWLLELNCTPIVHPGVYFPMLEGLFGPPPPFVPRIQGSVQEPAAVP